MALHVPKAPGFSQMLKDGARIFSGIDEAVMRNISACKEFSISVRSAYGPNGMNKMVINYLGKHFVTSDAATIIKELDVEHPAVKIIVMASQMQEEEIGDGTNFVIILAGALLEESEELIRLGISATEISEGYERAFEKCLEILPTLTCHTITDVRNLEAVKVGIKGSVMSKQYGQEDFLSDLISRACISIVPEKNTFSVDNIRICKIMGMGVHNTEVLQGMVFKRFVEGTVTNKKNAKIAMYQCPVDVSQTETKGTVLIKTATELLNFSRGEENYLEDQIKAIADAGADVIVAGAKFSDMALHFINKYKMMAVRLTSQFDLRRLSVTVGATVLPLLTPPTAQEMGYCDDVRIDEIGDTMVVLFKILANESKLATIVIRGSTDNCLNDIERTIDDGVNTYRNILRDGRFLPGAGATEIELSKQLSEYADTLPGIDQYAVRKFAKALEALPKAISDNTGIGTVAINNLFDAHKEGNPNAGFDIDSMDGTICNVLEKQIMDLYLLKEWGLKYATTAACTILRIDHIIMAKRAGAPKPSGQGDG